MRVLTIVVQMSDENLENKPLVEAIFEFRWLPLKTAVVPFRRDPLFYVLQGKLVPLLLERFPDVVSLLPPSMPLPDEILQDMLHFRLCSSGRQLPVVQIGPGVLTYNEGDTYLWKTFKEGFAFALEKLYVAYVGLQQTTPKQLFPHVLSLKYLNFFPCDFTSGQSTAYLQDTLGFHVGLPDSVLENAFIHHMPSALGFFWQYPCLNRHGDRLGDFVCSINTVEKDGVQGLFLELHVQLHRGTQSNLPEKYEDVLVWADDAHTVIHDSFFAIVARIKNHLKCERPT